MKRGLVVLLWGAAAAFSTRPKGETGPERMVYSSLTAGFSRDEYDDPNDTRKANQMGHMMAKWAYLQSLSKREKAEWLDGLPDEDRVKSMKMHMVDALNLDRCETWFCLPLWQRNLFEYLPDPPAGTASCDGGCDSTCDDGCNDSCDGGCDDEGQVELRTCPGHFQGVRHCGTACGPDRPFSDHYDGTYYFNLSAPGWWEVGGWFQMCDVARESTYYRECDCNGVSDCETRFRCQQEVCDSDCDTSCDRQCVNSW